THYLLANGPTDPLMSLYFSEGASSRPHPYHYRDDDNKKEFKSIYFMSIHSNYVPLRNEDVFIIKPYNPHRFSRQFGSFEDAPVGPVTDTPQEHNEEAIVVSKTPILKSKIPTP
ncbi:hypothetical protein HAX54_002767, partial [Datura stramonium]|nr:hypothetical protein [Datura stramonium]